MATNLARMTLFHTPRWREGGDRLPLEAGALVLLGAVLSGVLLSHTLALRGESEEARLAVERSLEQVADARRSADESERSLREALNTPVPALHRPYLVVSTVDRRLWYRHKDEVLMSAPVATGSGKTLVKEDGVNVWKFETPRGRLTVQSKEEHPVWVPPEWYYLEQAQKRKVGLARLERGGELRLSDGSSVAVEGDDVVRRFPGGGASVLKASDGHDIVVDRMLLVPPIGTNQRRFQGVLGDYRLNIGHGFGLHGTNHPESVGRAVSHGCVRMLNQDIAKLYQMVPVGTPVYIY